MAEQELDSVPAGSPVFVDANILVYASFPEFPFSIPAREQLNAIRRRGLPMWSSRQVLREFLASATRPGTLSPTPPVDSILKAVRLWADQFIIAEEDEPVTQHLFTLLVSPGVRGKQVHDANIVATMRRYGITYLLTHNGSDFARYAPGISILALHNNP